MSNPNQTVWKVRLAWLLDGHVLDSPASLACLPAAWLEQGPPQLLAYVVGEQIGAASYAVARASAPRNCFLPSGVPQVHFRWNTAWAAAWASEGDPAHLADMLERAGPPDWLVLVCGAGIALQALRRQPRLPENPLCHLLTFAPEGATKSATARLTE
ncbi:MAG: hypothetical protein QME77_01970 [bacterium]|nr:hypothetical protein [bacterium]